VRVDHRFTHPYEPVTKSLRAHALRRDARTFEQQEQFARQHVRLGERSRGAQLNEPLALSSLERLNHSPRRMVLFRQLDGGIGQRAATLVPAGHVGGHVLEPGTDDLIFDATANPDILNLSSAIATVRKKPIVWAEVFGGGIGGLIACSRPGVEPSPQHMRRAIENWFGERSATPVRSRRGYETGDERAPLIADDADVSAIAAHAARFAIDLSIGREPSLFPHSVYAIGLGVGSVFDQLFQTFPIEVGPPPQTEGVPELSPEESAEEFARLMALLKARADEAAAAVKDS
jgi:hypothetical protein